jgi:6-phosphofructokinase 1
VAAEGRKPGRAYDLAEAIRKKAGFDAKVCILGHIQRGGSPTATDRILASRLGSRAVDTIRQGLCDCMIGVDAGRLVTVPFANALGKKKTVPRELIELARVLSY